MEKQSKFIEYLRNSKLDLRVGSLSTLQVNITKLCNQACRHCHVDASPRRREMMSDEVIDKVIYLLDRYPSIETLDITGGAPELHPRFKDLVAAARQLGKQVLVRHNLTVSYDKHPIDKSSMEYLPEFFAEQKVELVSSLPYFQSYFTDKQRGDGVFEKSIMALRRLNAIGYAQDSSGLIINLVYNPVGSFLPPEQSSLERQYKAQLMANHQVSFNHLFVITNVPIKRFKAQLKTLGAYEEYMEKLVSSFNPKAAESIMCRSLVSVAFDGTIYDCDFNQMLDMPVNSKSSNILDFDLDKLLDREIAVADHCFACTAGAGSSCGGATVE